MDLAGFIASGEDLDTAKEHNNVISPPAFDIPLDQVKHLNFRYLLMVNVHRCASLVSTSPWASFIDCTL